MGDIASELDDGAKVVVRPGVSCGRCAQCLGGHDGGVDPAAFGRVVLTI